MEELICYNENCEYYRWEICPLDKTNCDIYSSYELSDGDCEDFKSKEDI